MVRVSKRSSTSSKIGFSIDAPVFGKTKLGLRPEHLHSQLESQTFSSSCGEECFKRCGGFAGAGIPAEVIVVDDASRDGSQRALFAMACAEPQGILDVVLADKNAGLPATRMKGLRRARYCWACLLDADNEILAENLTTFVRAADETGATMLYGNLITMLSGVANGFHSNDVVNETLLDDNYIDAFAIVDRRKILASGGYQEDMTSHEDWELTLHLIAEGERIVFVPAVLGYYHIENHSMVKTTAFEHRRMHRMFNQRRTGFSPAFKDRQMYHPEIGWL